MSEQRKSERNVNRRDFLKKATVSTAVLSAGATASAGKPSDHPDIAIPSTREIMAHVEALYGFGMRRPGSPADAKAEKYILAAFEMFGLSDCRMEPYPHAYWAPDEPKLTIRGSDTLVPCFFVPTTKFTPKEGLTAEMVYVGFGDDVEAANLRGKIVVFDQRFGLFPPQALEGISLYSHKIGSMTRADLGPQPWYRLNFDRVAKTAESQGAAGLIGLLSQMPYDTDRYYAPYDGHDWPFAGLWIRPSLCDTVRAHAKAGDAATMILTGSARPSVTHNVVGILPGKTDEIVMISSHHDSPFDSAVEDATGIAEVLALAEAFGKIGPRVLDKTLLFLACAAHFGENGALHFAKDHYSGLLPRVALNIHIEHVGIECEGRNGALVPTDRRQLRVVFTSTEEVRLASILKTAMIAEDLDRAMILPASNALTGPVFPADGSSIYAAGVPTMNYISAPIYLLNGEDTLDKVDRQQLVPVASTFARVIQAIDPVPLAAIRRPKAQLPEDFEISDDPIFEIRKRFQEKRRRTVRKSG